MRLFSILLLTASALCLPASAQTAQPGPDIAREAVAAAVQACRQLGFRTVATVVDSGGRPVATMAATPELARSLAHDSLHSAQIAAYFHDRSSNIENRITQEAAVFEAIHDHPQLSPLAAGGMPFPGPQTLASIGVAGPANRENLGAIGVAGAPDLAQDEECGRDGVMHVLAELK
jgi:uncharacterized protein GlcG (DUF336 family)